jgi:hypothetical protein
VQTSLAPPDDPIDVVYLWVDGGDPHFQKLLRTYQQREYPHLDSHSWGAHRYRDNGTLRFSLRSLEANAPWVRHVHLVTNGQVPSWLSLHCPKLSLVRHEDLFPDRAHLPTFNNHAITMHLSRIPNLARWFLCLDDDLFLGSSVLPRHFRNARGGPAVFANNWGLPEILPDAPVHDRAYAHTQGLFDQRFGRRVDRRRLAHTPLLYDQEILNEVYRIWQDEVMQTSARRFRSPRDVVLQVLYSCYLLEVRGKDLVPPPEIVELDLPFYQFVMLTNDAVRARLDLAWVTWVRPRFFCLNDDLDDAIPATHVLTMLNDFMQHCYPHPSVFEKQAPSIEPRTQPPTSA